jgi:hypothetical protein
VTSSAGQHLQACLVHYLNRIGESNCKLHSLRALNFFDQPSDLIRVTLHIFDLWTTRSIDCGIGVGREPRLFFPLFEPVCNSLVPLYKYAMSKNLDRGLDDIIAEGVRFPSCH